MLRSTLSSLIFACLCSSGVFAESEALAEEVVTVVEEEVIILAKEEEAVRVTVLGYHEFTPSQEATEMRLPVPKLRQQLQEIKDNNLNVITLEEFIAWKKGETSIPDRSVLITIDDGWKSVYTCLLYTSPSPRDRG